MKLLNFSPEVLIAENMRVAPKETATTVQRKYSHRQFEILSNLIRQKRITREFFDYVVTGLFHVDNWKLLNYDQVYLLIHTLTYFDYEKAKDKL